MTTCTAHGSDWACDRPAKACGLCTAHLSQRDRGQELRPLREHGQALKPLTIRFPPDVVARATQDPLGARSALERWARQTPA